MLTVLLLNPYKAEIFLLNPLNPHDALKHLLASMKNYLIFNNHGFWNENFHESVLKITVYFFICHPLQVIFIHYESRIATAIRGS